MTQNFEALEARLRALEDRDAIRDLVAHYGPLADVGDAEGIANLWAEGGDYMIAGLGVASGRAAISALIQSDEHRALMADGCAHLLGAVAIEIDGDRASARGHSIVFRHREDGFDVYRVSANRWEFARGAAGWCVVHRSNALLDGNETARMLLCPTR